MDKPRQETTAWFFPENHPKMESGDWLALLLGMAVGYVGLLFGWLVALGAALLLIYINENSDE